MQLKLNPAYPAPPAPQTTALIITPAITGGFVVTAQPLSEMGMPTSILAAFSGLDDLVAALQLYFQQLHGGPVPEPLPPVDDPVPTDREQP